MKSGRILALGLLGLLLSVAAARACTGGMNYYNSNNGDWEWCNGTTWYSAQGTEEASCSGTTGGTIRYSSSLYEYCNGTDWYSMKGTEEGSCSGTTAGTSRYSSNKMEFCDGTDWWEFNTNTPHSGRHGLTAGTTSWTVPPDWNGASNTIAGIGGGGGGGSGGGAGGGGGEYCANTNVSLTIGTSNPPRAVRLYKA
jgi:hypothetical protein